MESHSANGGGDPIRVAFLGFGGIAVAHMKGYRAVGDAVEIAAVAEPNPARHSVIREHLGDDVEIHRDYLDVLARPDIDAVDIVLPHDMHMSATIAAAKAGKHILVEKVMARNVWECDRMIEACESDEASNNGVSLVVSHDRRYEANWAALKEIIDSGDLGEIFFLKLDHNQNVAPGEGHWIRDRNRLGGGAVMSCLTHQIDGLRWFAGEVSEVTAMSRTLPDRMEGETVGVVLARMASGAMAELSINWFTDANRNGRDLWYEMVHVCGTAGEAYYMLGRGLFVRFHTGADPAVVAKYGEESLSEFVPVRVEPQAGHVGCIRAWTAHLHRLLRPAPAADGIPEVRTFGRDCRGTVEVAEAAYRSEAEGRRVALPIEPQPWDG